MEKLKVFLVLAVSLCLAAAPTIAQQSTKRPATVEIGHFIAKCTDKRHYCASREDLISASSRSIDEDDDFIRFESEEFGDVPQANASESTFPTFCRCDNKCSAFGDCCLDSTETSPPLTNINAAWTCLPLAINEVNRLQIKEKASMFMIGACPKGSDEILTSKCLQKESSLYDYSYMMDVPVLSKNTRQMYANIFCAQCNADFDNLEIWNVTVQYNDDNSRDDVSHLLAEAKYVPKERRWLRSNDTAINEYAIVINDFVEPMQFILRISGRHCIQAIDECPTDWPDKKQKESCQSYALYVETTGGEQVFKNPHCAKCNGASNEDLHCYGTSGTSFRTFSRPGGYDYSFSLLMNFNWRKQCSDNEVFDPIRSVCQSFFCGKDFEQLNGTCVRKEQANNPSIQTSYLNSSCPRVNLSRGVDFEFLGNGSIVLLESKILLDLTEYEPADDNTSVQICAEEKAFFGYSSAQRIVSDVCLSISIICLALHIILLGTQPNTRNLPGKNLLSLSFSLFFAHLLFLLGINARETVGYGACAAIGAFIHWFYLAAFFWMNVMGFEIWKTFANTTAMISHHNSFMSGRRRSTFVLYSAYAWFTPTLIVVLGLVFDFTHLADEYAPQYGEQFCWIGNRTGLGVFFVLPLAVLLLANCTFFGITAWTIVQHRRSTKPSKLPRHESTKLPPLDAAPNKNSGIQMIQNTAKKAMKLQVRFMLYVKLALIMGLGWTFGFIAGLADRPGLWYPFILLNALQGAFIFLAFSCKQKTLDNVRETISSTRHRFAFKTTSNIRLTNSAVQTLSFTPATTSTSLN